MKHYPCSVIGMLHPRTAVLSHFDNFFHVYKNGEDAAKGMEFFIFAAYDELLDELKRSYRET